MTAPVALRCGILLWHADTLPPQGAFDRVWIACRDRCPSRYVTYRDVDDVTTSDGPGVPWAQIFPDHGVPAPPPEETAALLVVRTRPTQALDEEEFNAWYDTDHLPPLAASASCRRVRRFHRPGEAYPYLALYDISDWAAWETNPARAQVRASEWARRVVPLFERTEGYYSPLNAAAATGEQP